jgi:hypothetical protein
VAKAGTGRRAGLTAGLVLAASAASAAPAADWPDITGRWQAKVRVQHTLPARAIEIARCADGLCGRIIGADGSCGPVILRLTENRTGTLLGTITIGGLAMRAYAARQAEGLLVGAHPPHPKRASQVVLPLVAEYDRQGPVRCAAERSFRRGSPEGPGGLLRDALFERSSG